jgi:hypothetical protein
VTVDLITLATEDALSEAIGRRLLAESPLASAHAPSRAAERSPSLARARQALARLRE